MNGQFFAVLRFFCVKFQFITAIDQVFLRNSIYWIKDTQKIQSHLERDFNCDEFSSESIFIFSTQKKEDK